MLISVHQLSHEQKCHAFATEFIPVTVVFAEKWGLEMVPTDLRYSVNDICTNIGMPVISCSPMHYIHNDGTVRTLEVTYRIGCALEFV